MLRVLLLAAASLLGGVSLGAQSPEQEVRSAVDQANKAALAHDTEGYARFLADDLIWLGANGMIISKQQRLRAIINPPNPRTLGDIDVVQIYGDSAVLVVTATRADGSKRRIVRTLVKRDGRWQLVLHAESDVK